MVRLNRTARHVEGDIDRVPTRGAGPLFSPHKGNRKPRHGALAVALAVLDPEPSPSPREPIKPLPVQGASRVVPSCRTVCALGEHWAALSRWRGGSRRARPSRRGRGGRRSQGEGSHRGREATAGGVGLPLAPPPSGLGLSALRPAETIHAGNLKYNAIGGRLLCGGRPPLRQREASRLPVLFPPAP